MKTFSQLRQYARENPRLNAQLANGDSGAGVRIPPRGWLILSLNA